MVESSVADLGESARLQVAVEAVVSSRDSLHG